MQPENQGKMKKTPFVLIVKISVSSVFVILLALLAVFAYQQYLNLNAKLQSMQYALDQTQMDLDGLRGSVELPIPVFSIASFELTYSKDNYGEAYGGNVIIACDQPDPYVVILKTTLVSGGSTYSDTATYSLVIIQDGFGKSTTYDWAEPGKLVKPVYRFEVAGYFRAEKSAMGMP